MASTALPQAPAAVLQSGDRLLSFESPLAAFEARDPGSVLSLLREADAALAGGQFVAGYVAYEAAAAFGLAAREPDDGGPPLAWLGVFDAPRELACPPADAGPARETGFRPALDTHAHGVRFGRIQERINAGDCSRAVLSFPLTAALVEEPAGLFARLCAAQRPRRAAYLDLGRFAIVSISPEVLFEREAGLLQALVVTGTAPRGATPERDDAASAALVASPQRRAHGQAVVDAVCADLGRAAEAGRVEVVTLFDVERSPTRLQLVSQMRARSDAPLSMLFEALFPGASVTGTPRRRSMELIAATESGPRGVFAGTTGWAGPGGRAEWSVALRTVVADRDRGLLSAAVRSSVVAGSPAETAYQEGLDEARWLDEAPFALVETFAHLPGEGFRRLDAHLARLAGSARHFGFPLETRRVEEALRRAKAELVAAARVRLLLHGDGRVEVEATALSPLPSRTLQVGLAARPVDPRSPWLYHKTTRREAYDEASASRPDCDEVLLWNERGELTESTTASVVVEIGGQRLTPPVPCGLLPGVERAVALAEGRAREGVVRISELASGQRLWLLSSLRGAREARLVG